VLHEVIHDRDLRRGSWACFLGKLCRLVNRGPYPKRKRHLEEAAAVETVVEAVPISLTLSPCLAVTLALVAELTGGGGGSSGLAPSRVHFLLSHLCILLKNLPKTEDEVLDPRNCLALHSHNTNDQHSMNDQPGPRNPDRVEIL
jgi:hypothetical protein